MNKTAIKNFAIWARNKLIADVSYDARLIGITEDGIVKPLPQSFGGTQFFDIGTAEPYSISGEAVRQRDKLIEVIQQKEKDTDYKTAYQYVIEEVAYTWFNRLIAIRFMEVNDYGFMAMINIPVWMSKSSFEQLRYKLLALHTFVAVAHCGRGIFGSDFGTVAFVVQNSHIKMYKALFRQLFDELGAVDSVEQKEIFVF